MSDDLCPARRGWYTGDLDIAQAAPARVYEHLLGGPHTFAVDRELAAALLTAVPDVTLMARANRAFIHRALRHLVGAGIRQFLDLGCGLQSAGSVQNILLRTAPCARVVHVDLDPVTVAHTGAAISDLGRNDLAVAVHADIRDPATILNHPGVHRVLDLGEPVGILVTAVLHHLTEDTEPDRVLTELGAATVAGTFLVLSHLTAESRPRDIDTLLELSTRAGIPARPRTHTDLTHLLRGWDLPHPGVTWAPRWRPDPSEHSTASVPTLGHRDEHREPDPERSCVLAAVARKPTPVPA